MRNRRHHKPVGHQLWQRRLVIGLVGVAFGITSCLSTGWSAGADEPTIAPPAPGSTTPAAQPGAPDIVLISFDDANKVAGWTTVNDPVMGGRSTSEITFADGGLRFSGNISLENNGGFASARGPVDPDIGRKAAGARSLRIRALGDGKTYVLKVGTAGQPWSYIQRFRTEAGTTQVYDLAVDGFEPVGMRLDPAPYAPQTLDPSSISQVSMYILDKQQGPFAITVNAIERG